MKDTVVLGLCAGRHEIPHVNEYIFNTIENVFDTEFMANTIEEKLCGYENAVIYVTGLTIALVEVIRYCHKSRINLHLYHYNAATAEYILQELPSLCKCGCTCEV